jgi:HSP20 family protein
MDPIRWRNGLADPFQDFEDLQEEINRLFDLTCTPEPRGIFDRAFSPAVDVVEYPDNFEVICDVPGVDIADVEISVAANVLTLKGERRAGKKDDAKTYRQETSVGRFQRTLQLPLPIDTEKVDAALKDGTLRIVLPKHDQLKPRQIAVQAK